MLKNNQHQTLKFAELSVILFSLLAVFLTMAGCIQYHRSEMNDAIRSNNWLHALEHAEKCCDNGDGEAGCCKYRAELIHNVIYSRDSSIHDLLSALESAEKCCGKGAEKEMCCKYRTELIHDIAADIKSGGDITRGKKRSRFEIECSKSDSLPCVEILSQVDFNKKLEEKAEEAKPWLDAEAKEIADAAEENRKKKDELIKQIDEVGKKLNSLDCFILTNLEVVQKLEPHVYEVQVPCFHRNLQKNGECDLFRGLISASFEQILLRTKTIEFQQAGLYLRLYAKRNGTEKVNLKNGFDKILPVYVEEKTCTELGRELESLRRSNKR